MLSLRVDTSVQLCSLLDYTIQYRNSDDKLRQDHFTDRGGWFGSKHKGYRTSTVFVHSHETDHSVSYTNSRPKVP